MKLFISIRASYVTKVIVSFIAFNLIFGVLFPMRSFALPEGPTQPEFNNFTPIGVSDMVDLSSGDFNYSIPLLDVGGYPLSLGYNSSTNFDEASSWVGHGWDLSAGQINRSMRVIPDDYDGTDEIITEDSRKPDITYALGSSVIASIIGFDKALGNKTQKDIDTAIASEDLGNVSLNGSFGLVAVYNNYTGFSITPSLGVSGFVHDKLNEKGSASINLTPSSTDGVSINTQFGFNGEKTIIGAGLTYNSFDKKLSVNSSISTVIVPNKDKNKTTLPVGNLISFNRPTSFISDYGLGYQNISGKFNVAGGLTFWGVDGKGELYVNYAEQRLDKKYHERKVPAYGYNHSSKGTEDGMKDYTKSNSRTFNQNTATLSVPQNMYDMYSISGQGLQGSFKPQNSQVGYNYEPKVRNTSNSVNLGLELAAGAGFKVGGNIEATHSNSNSGFWTLSKGNRAQNMLSKQPAGIGSKPNYQDNYFKMIGENSVKNPIDGTNGYVNKIGNKDVLQLRIERTNFNPNSLNSESLTKISPNYFTVSNSGTASPIGTGGAKIIQNERIPTAKTISPTSIADVTTYNAKLTSATNDVYVNLNKIELASNSQLKKHHEAGFKIVDESGTIYNYTQPLENKISQNVSFSVSNRSFTQDKSQVNYSLKEASTNNTSGTDNYFSKKTIPGYTHTSLLKSILSSDYQDKESNGPSPDDLGSYTVFKYTTPKSVKYRFPVQAFEASYSEGFKSLKGDDKANFSYGEKEVSYLERIITKTHVAVFKLNVDTSPISKRKDNLTAKDVNNGVDENGHTRYLDKIYLYTLKQAEDLGLLDQNIPSDFENSTIHRPLKVVHFEYDYSLQSENGGLPNSAVVAYGNGRAGKLTLKSVYFTYGSSTMGKLTPYSFQYNQDVNYKYHNLNKDVWGNYKPNVTSTLTDSNNLEFPYTNQDESVNGLGLRPADLEVSKFLLSKIKLPSGGIISVNYEADDYAFVQDKRAMQMVEIKGFGDNPEYNGASPNIDFCYTHAGPRKYVYLKVEKNNITDSDKVGSFRRNYLESIENEPIFFKILANINPENTTDFNEYVTGYTYLTKLDAIKDNNFSISGSNHYIVAVELAKPKLNGGSGSSVHPFAKATWNYSKQYLSEVAFDGSDSSLEGLSPVQAVKKLGKDMLSLINMFKGPNKTLRDLKSGRKININKSFLRLQDGNKIKLGGGARVKSVLIDSNWDSMLNNNTTASSSTETLYGQEYSYKDATGTYSSGVASFEPQNSEENPLMLPFEDNNNLPNNADNSARLIDKFLAPINSNYVVGPLMKDYYPNPQITYSRVTVKNIKPVHPTNSSKQIIDKATGYVVNDFYTHKDFPTIEKQTPIDINFTAGTAVKDFVRGMIGIPANIYSSKKLIATQGFYVETNDMNGKPKSQTVYAEGASGDNFITKTEYNYQIDANGKLNNFVTLVDQFGDVTQEEIGVEYDVVNDFAINTSSTINAGADYNVVVIPLFLIPLTIPAGIPSLSNHETQNRVATTAKHVHRSGILKSTTVYDKGSSITTENLAYDYLSRMPILKRVNNEFGDVIYNMDFPAYWVHQEMANSSFNTDMKFNTGTVTNNKYSFTPGIIDSSTGMQYLVNGDVVQETVTGDIFWVTNVDTSTNTYELIDVNGFNVNLNKQVKIVKSGYDNKPGQSISSISLSENPIQITANGLTLRTINESFKIFNASAIELKEEWLATCECGYDELPTLNGNGVFNDPNKTINPYVNNLKGQYRPVKSWAYLSGRTTTTTSSSTTQPRLRNDGFYKDYSPFYTLVDHDNNNVTPNRWIKSTNLENTKWQYASEVSKISPYGLELENKDPLDVPRFSAATYGFNKKFPSAVASNTEYRELAFDGFEDYDYIEHDDEHFAFAKALNHYQIINGFTQTDTIIWENHITNEEHHTGNYALEVGTSENIGMNYILSNPTCEPGSPEIVYGHLREIIKNINLNNQQDPNDFQNLIPYITNNSGQTPALSNIVNTSNVIAFNFFNDPSALPLSHSNFSRDVIIELNCNTPNNCPTISSQSDFQTRLIDLLYSIPVESVNGSTVSETLDIGNDMWISLTMSRLSLYGNCFNECTSFSPKQGSNYIVSAWVKEDINRNNANTPQQLKNVYPTTYENGSVSIAFTDVNGTPVGTPSQFKFKPSGKIINGWQKVYGTFRVNNNANIIKVVLTNDSESTSAFFDDIRIHPVNGSMKSFVYDDKTFRLAAELDDNNYATFYEYDLEGNLIRIKKETERGIMTIQESRQGMSKPTPLN